MKAISLSAIIMVLCIIYVNAQKVSIDLTFTAAITGGYVKPDSIKVLNRSQSAESTIYYPDTTLSLEITPGDTLLYIGYSTGYPFGVQEINQPYSDFKLYQSYPNPAKDQSMVSMYLPGTGTVSLLVNDIRGKVIVSKGHLLEQGVHYFRFSPGNSSFYLLTAVWNGSKETIKIINTEPGHGRRCTLKYAGSGDHFGSFDASLPKRDMTVLESGILDAPASNKTYTFRFATSIPCPGTPTVEYEGQVYNTIQVFNQCWLKENLNAGTMINNSQNQTNNSTREKYCYDNNPDSCTKYGGLYQWNEMMQYTTQQGARGICPPDWHLPTDEEWKVLEGSVDSQYGIGDPEWDLSWDYRGYDAGSNLKTTSGWHDNGNGTDLYGLSCMPGGYRYWDGNFHSIGIYGTWWSSTENKGNDTFAWYRYLNYHYEEIYRNFNYKDYGVSVRCLRDY